MEFGLFLIMLAFASDENKFEGDSKPEDVILVKIEEDEYTKVPKKTSKYIGVSYNEPRAKWQVHRFSKDEKKAVKNGTYKDEEAAAHASDTLARKLMANGEKNHKLNFPNDNTEVYPEERTKTSKYIGVSYNGKLKKWAVQRRSKREREKMVTNGNYKDEETAAHASDTLARKLMENGEQNHKLNFPNDESEVYPEQTTSSIYIGVAYCNRDKVWCTSRWSKIENKTLYNGYYEDEESAAHASDTLARKIMASGEVHHKLNFPDDHTEVYPERQRNKRKRSDRENLGHS